MRFQGHRQVVPKIKAFAGLLRRRRFFINKPLQGRLLILSLLYVSFVLLVLAAVFFTPVIMDLEEADASSRQAIDAANLLLFLHARFWICAVLAIAVVSLDSIRISHRIAGPLRAFHAVFDSLRSGHIPTPLNLRRKDLLKPEAAKINAMLDGLREKVDEIEAARGQLGETLAACAKQAEGSPDRELAALVEDVTTRARELDRKLEFFEND